MTYMGYRVTLSGQSIARFVAYSDAVEFATKVAAERDHRTVEVILTNGSLAWSSKVASDA